jgi:hypothetical protein
MLLATSGRVCVASITYTILSFHGAGSKTNFGSNGFTPSDTPIQGVVAGTITTDGALGNLTSSDITSWSWSAGGATGQSSGPMAGLTAVGLFATGTTLSLLPTVTNGPVMQVGEIQFGNETTAGPNVLSSADLTFEAINGGITWNASTFSIASGGSSIGIGGAYRYPSLVFASVNGGVPPGIPEPSTITLAVLAVASLCVMRMRRRAFKA